MPIGGFGNLIALPLQRKAREHGNSVFINKELRPYEDQWAFLSSLPRLSATPYRRSLSTRRCAAGCWACECRSRMSMQMSPGACRRRGAANRDYRCPPAGQDRRRHCDQIYIDRTGLPPAMTARLIRLAAFQNPEFYRAQAMRLPTFGKPRIISCAELHPRHVGLPRGCLDEILELIRTHGAQVVVEDLRTAGTPLSTSLRFQGCCAARRSKRSTHSRRTTMACWRQLLPLARRSWPPRLSLNERVTPSFWSIVESYGSMG